MGFRMPLNDDQKRLLLTNLARDKAENLRNELLRTIEQAKANPPAGLSEENRKLGEYAMQRALESAQRMVENLEKAMKLAEEMATESRPPEED